MSGPDDVLTEWERLAQDATEGPWGRLQTHVGGVNIVGPDPTYQRSLATVGPDADAAFIAAARTAWPAATAALRAVLNLHRPDPANGTTWAWPCATAQAVNDAVGGQG